MSDLIKSEVANGTTPLSRMSPEIAMQAYQDAVDCTLESIEKICFYVFNPLNSSFKLVLDTDDIDRDDAIKPSEMDEDVIAGMAGGTESFDFPLITGAEEFASGMGDSLVAIEGDDVVYEIIPRDSYDDPMPNDVTEKIYLDIISDTTGTAELKLIDSSYVYKSGSSYYGTVTASSPGVVKIIASVCGKTIKAFTYNGLVNETTGEVSATTENCIELAQAEKDNTTIPLGSVLRVDRVLTINFLENTEANNGILSNVGDDSFDQMTKSITDPQQLGTKLEN